jgi:hypothetical protein
LLFVAVLVTLGVAEVALRIADMSFPQIYRPDPWTGVSHSPGVSGRWTKEGDGPYRMNSEGFRDEEHDKAKPEGVFRIAVLGDSYAEALQVSQEEAFWSVLERELERCPALGGRRVESINFGTSGYGTAQELMTLRHRVWDYDPDVVLLAFLTGNDLRNNVRELERDPARPYFVVRDGQLVLDDSFLQSPVYLNLSTWPWRVKARVLDASRTAQLIYEGRRLLKQREMAEAQVNDDKPVYMTPKSSWWLQAWDVTLRLLETMRDEVVAAGARFELVVLTNGVQVHPDPSVRAEYRELLGVETLTYPDERIAAFAREKGIPVLSLVAPFLAAAEARGVCLHGFENAVPCGGHWNEMGHRLGGELMAADLCRRITEDAPADQVGRKP